MPFSKQDPGNEASRQTDHRDIRLPMKVERRGEPNGHGNEGKCSEQCQAAPREEQPNYHRPKGDHENDADCERRIVGHVKPRGDETMIDNLPEGFDLEQPPSQYQSPPFMKLLEDGWTDFWSPPTSSESYRGLVALGEHYAEMAVVHARQRQDPLVLELVISTITSKVSRGALTIGPLELGFFHRLSSLAYVGSLN
jgi:hypothetical protein